MDNWNHFMVELNRYAGARVSIPGLIFLLAAVTPVVGGLMVTYHYVMKLQADDDREAAEHSRSIKTVLKVTLLGVSLIAVVHQLFLLSRYSGAPDGGWNPAKYFNENNCYFRGFTDATYEQYRTACPDFATEPEPPKQPEK